MVWAQYLGLNIFENGRLINTEITIKSTTLRKAESQSWFQAVQRTLVFVTTQTGTDAS